MFMQIINTIRRGQIDNAGVAKHRANDITFAPPGQNFNGPILDDYETNKGTQSLGYPFIYKDNIARGWNLTASAFMPPLNEIPQPSAPEMTDMPTHVVPLNYKGLRAEDSFSTYLMFRPSEVMWNGVWVAIAQVDWPWTLAENNVNGAWPTGYNKAQPAPVVMGAPSGGKEFPLWVNNGKNFFGDTLNPLQPGL